MPKQTFLNLSESKRQAIIDTALEEFSTNDYNTASLSKIVERAGIAKGSMYRYFESKKELYLYLIDYASEKKLQFVSRNLKDISGGFFKAYKTIIFHAAKFDLENPKYSRIVQNAGRERFNPEIADVAARIIRMSMEYLKQFILVSQQLGQVRKDIDIELVAFIISMVTIDLGSYLEMKYGFSYEDAIKRGSGVLPVTDEQLSDVLEKTMQFFREGIGT